MTSMAITIARVQRDDEDNYWLHVQSQSGKAASLNLPKTGGGWKCRSITRRWRFRLRWRLHFRWNPRRSGFN